MNFLSFLLLSVYAHGSRAVGGSLYAVRRCVAWLVGYIPSFCLSAHHLWDCRVYDRLRVLHSCSLFRCLL